MRWTTLGFAATTVLLTGLLAGCFTVRDPARPRPPEPAGRTQYESYCAGCHDFDGQGVPAEAPPLVGSEWVKGPEQRLIRILLHGVRGPIEVAGKTYNREMPGLGQALNDADLASLASFVRGVFGGVTPPIDAETVSRIRAAAAHRKTPWTADELLADR
jgi:mono/diheme cytochrome c family protein